MAAALEQIRNLPWHAQAWAELATLHARQVHAVLLHGAAGIGKKGLAFDFAAALLCEAPRADARACGACTGCALFAAGSHPDLRVLVPDTLAHLRPAPDSDEGEGESEAAAETSEAKSSRASREIKIETVRALSNLVGVSSHRGGRRVVLLAPAEALNAPSANALLKMLEEPPPQTVFVLTSDNLDQVLPTIRSRCVLLRVRPPTQAQALQWLQGQGVADPAGALAAVGGAPLAALPREESSEVLDAGAHALLLDLLGAGKRLTPAEIVARLPRTVPVPEAIALFQRWAWDLLAVRLAKRVRYHPKRLTALQSIAADAPVAGLTQWSSRLAQARAVADHPLNPRLVIEALLIEYQQCLQPNRSN
jgi:DNA polymerase-3 subunit delta'